MGVLPAHMPVLTREYPETGRRHQMPWNRSYPTVSCEPTRGCREFNPSPLAKKPVLLTDKPSLWTPTPEKESLNLQTTLLIVSNPDPYNPSPTVVYT